MFDLRQPLILSRNVRRYGFLGLLFCAAGALVAPGCYVTDDLEIPEVPEVPEEPPQIRATIDEDGAISAVSDDGVSLGIDGHWYAYGDAYGEGSDDGMGGAFNSEPNAPPSCTGVGKHQLSECSTMNLPTVQVPELGFENNGGVMCSHGSVAEVLNCCDGSSDAPVECSGVNTLNCDPEGKADYSNMWGAGIGFDFNLEPTLELSDEKRDNAAIVNRKPWNATAHGVIGISFELVWSGPELGREEESDGASDRPIPLRVEFPVRTTFDVKLPQDKGTLVPDGEGGWNEVERGAFFMAGISSEFHPRGSPFWRAASDDWGPSPVRRGTNTIRWKDVNPPPKIPDYDSYLPKVGFTGENLLGIQFHVFSKPDEKTPFSFCISDLRFLLEDEEPAE